MVPRTLPALLLLLASVVTATAAPPPASPLVIGFLGDVSGPVGFWNAPRLAGIQDAIEYVNNERGGVAGRPLALEWRDHRSDAGLAEKYYRELKDKTFHVWHTCGTGEQQMLKPLMEQDQEKVFFTCSTSPGVVYPAGNVFGTGPYYPDQFGAFIDWLATIWKKEGHTRPPKVALLTYKSGYGRAFLTDESLAYAKKRGVELLEVRYIPFVTTAPLPLLQQAKKDGADWVYGLYLWQTIPPYLVANREHKLGLRFAVANFTVDDVLIAQAGQASEGVIGISSWTLPSEETPGIKLVHDYLKKKRRAVEDRASSYYLGWMNVLQTERAIRETFERVKGWDKVDAAALRATMEKWRDVDIFGLGHLNFSADQRTTRRIRLVEVKKGRWVPISDWFDAPNLAPPAEPRRPAAPHH